MTYALWIQLAQLTAVVVGLAYTGFQLDMARKIARYELTLRLHELMRPYDDIRRALLSGRWKNGGNGPSGDDEWFDLQKYLGLLEDVQRLIDDGIADAAFMRRKFRHRVRPIARHEEILSRLKREDSNDPGKWADFFRLCDTLTAE
jgi:hypothetical protein